ncbi:MAG: phosphodiester glycosidase family protein [Lachnospiraceae bacterium]|nr:phosphodiester glycosidase family protein [Lachnospiraceae bacterium]MBP3611344.1 phosphodiester glycosidase family protein [Lachnospiraceae bacterium]
MSAELTKDPGKQPVSIGRVLGKIIFRLLLLLFTTAAILAGGIYGLVYTFNYGPSPSARSLFVTSVLETSALDFLATWFLPSEEIATILATNNVEQMDAVSNPDLIVIPEHSETSAAADEKEIEITEVSGLTYSGRMMIVKDPSRVFVGTCASFGNPDGAGEKLLTIAGHYNAIAGINGGGFYDPNGTGTGSIPTGFVFSQGEFLYGPRDTSDLIIGFDHEDKLIVGYMTADEAAGMGIRDALTFGPALIINGEPASVSGSSSGLNPRTAIGQRADGAVLLLVIDGRQPGSLGASYADLIEVMLRFGAVNAANLDGGSSSLMIFEDEIVSSKSGIIGDRRMPTCFLVERRDTDEE